MKYLLVLFLKVCKYWAMESVIVQCPGQVTLFGGVWRYQRGKYNPHIAEEENRQWPNEKVQKFKQRSSKYYN